MLILLLFGIKFGKTKQIVVALVATTPKALLTVTQTSVRLAGSDFCAGNIYHLFGNIFTHTFTLSAYKKCAPKGAHRKNASPSIVVTRIALPTKVRGKGENTFYQKYFPFVGHKYSIRATSIFYHIFACLSIKLENLSKYYCFGVFNHADSCQKKRTENVSKFSVLFLSEGNIFY